MRASGSGSNRGCSTRLRLLTTDHRNSRNTPLILNWSALPSFTPTALSSLSAALSDIPLRARHRARRIRRHPDRQPAGLLRFATTYCAANCLRQAPFSAASTAVMGKLDIADKFGAGLCLTLRDARCCRLQAEALDPYRAEANRFTPNGFALSPDSLAFREPEAAFAFRIVRPGENDIPYRLAIAATRTSIQLRSLPPRRLFPTPAMKSPRRPPVWPWTTCARC